MPVMTVGTGRALIPTGINYNDLVMGTGPIAYWPQSESSGLVARCLTNPAMNGTYSGVTLANDNTGPFGTPAPFYDGATSYNDVFSAALAAAFNGQELTVAAWAKVNAVGVWTDAADRRVTRLIADANNYATMRKGPANNTADWFFSGGGVADTYAEAPISITDWFHVAITVSRTADRIDYWINGASVGNDVGVGLWAGPLVAANCCIGARDTVPTLVWHGWLGPFGIWAQALPIATMEVLALI